MGKARPTPGFSLFGEKQIEDLFVDFLDRGPGQIGAYRDAEHKLRTDPEAGAKAVVGAFMAVKHISVLLSAEPA